MVKIAASPRIHFLDNLRGVVLIGILLLHAVEHFSLYLFPESGPAWLIKLDGYVTHAVFLLFFGKAYAVFALLFGVSYHIQQRNNLLKGIDHKRRMLLRMGWLFLFGLVHGSFYPGDILCILAVFGMLLILIAELPSRVLLVLAAIISLQPVLLYSALNDGSTLFANENERLESLIASLRDDGPLRLLWNNLWNNRFTEWMFMVSSGRMLQLAAWMMVGIVASRNGYFQAPARTLRFNLVAFSLAAILYLILAYFFRGAERPWLDLFTRWKEMMLVTVYISAAMLLAVRWQALNRSTLLAKYGRMSLTNYVTQGMLGAMLFYGAGFKLYRLGATLSVVVAIGILALQWLFTWWWSKRNPRGPLEESWHRLTVSRSDKYQGSQLDRVI